MTEAIKKLTMMWANGIPFQFDLYGDPICAILKRKMLLVGLDDVIPDHLYAVVSLLSNGNPGMCQIILKEILMASREDVKNSFAMGTYLGPFVIDKVILRFGGKLPDAQDATVAKTLERLYMEQKIQSEETLSDNAMDTQRYWDEVTMAGKIDESVPYCERLKFYSK